MHVGRLSGHESILILSSGQITLGFYSALRVWPCRPIGQILDALGSIVTFSNVIPCIIWRSGSQIKVADRISCSDFRQNSTLVDFRGAIPGEPCKGQTILQLSRFWTCPLRWSPDSGGSHFCQLIRLNAATDIVGASRTLNAR